MACAGGVHRTGVNGGGLLIDELSDQVYVQKSTGCWTFTVDGPRSVSKDGWKESQRQSSDAVRS